MAKIKVAGAALNQIPIHWKNNIENIGNAIKMAKSDGVDILCLPELCLTGYGCEDLFLSEWLPEKAVSLISKILPLTDNIAVSIGLPIGLERKTYNCIAVLKNGEIIGITAKQFLANDGVHYEPRWFTAWEPAKVIDIEIGGEKIPFGDLTYDLFGVRTGFEICEDAWRPDRPACRMIDKNVQLILNPSASHFAFGKSYTRERLVIESSKKFSCYYIYANLLGNEAGRMIYDGEIVIAGHGQLLHFNNKLSFKDVNLVSTEIDPNDQNPIPNFPSIPKEDKNEIFVQAEAIALFEAILVNKPFMTEKILGPYSKALEGKASKLMETDQEEAKALLFKSMMLNPESAQGHYLLGRLYSKEKNNTGAIASFRRGETIKFAPS